MSVAASSQKLCLLLTQEHLEQGQEKIESASEAKTPQVIDGQYLKECSLTDKAHGLQLLLRKNMLTIKY